MASTASWMLVGMAPLPGKTALIEQSPAALPPQELKLGSFPNAAIVSITLEDGTIQTGVTPFLAALQSGHIEEQLSKTGHSNVTRGLTLDTASVYEIDRATRTIKRQFKTGGTWTKVILLSPDVNTLWAPNWCSNDVSDIDLATGELARRMNTVVIPRGLYVTPDGKLLAFSDFLDDTIRIYRTPHYATLATGGGGRADARLYDIIKH